MVYFQIYQGYIKSLALFKNRQFSDTQMNTLLVPFLLNFIKKVQLFQARYYTITNSTKNINRCIFSCALIFPIIIVNMHQLRLKYNASNFDTNDPSINGLLYLAEYQADMLLLDALFTNIALLFFFLQHLYSAFNYLINSNYYIGEAQFINFQIILNPFLAIIAKTQQGTFINFFTAIYIVKFLFYSFKMYRLYKKERIENDAEKDNGNFENLESQKEEEEEEEEEADDSCDLADIIVPIEKFNTRKTIKNKHQTSLQNIINTPENEDQIIDLSNKSNPINNENEEKFDNEEEEEEEEEGEEEKKNNWHSIDQNVNYKKLTLGEIMEDLNILSDTAVSLKEDCMKLQNLFENHD